MAIENAYREDLAFIHDDGYGAVARSAAEKLLLELARVGHREGTVVDLGCGSGILARPMGDAGYRVIGIDVSAAMVALARKRAPNAEFHVGSFVSAELPACAAVTAIGEVLNYCFDSSNDERAWRDLFQRVHQALQPDGLFLFDVAGRDRAKPGKHRSFAEGTGWAVLVETALNEATGMLTRNITSFRQVGALYQRDAEVHRLRLVDRERVLELLRAAGFDAQAIPAYGATPLPPGIAAFFCRKAANSRPLIPS